ncbi:hypothetical protein AG1IA_03576 [Rhizoctonia solani AG-1 IA]|uniref:Uncharacterized protein n=1 Tax=Thanatephorus cucumeris (strain AG1-IA) TaxID=983506 RepID=L8WZZ8_THACA|nr:hypothetical protein AG1IA_03576 [Rhizoctonia solani AG-1 IA]
MPDVAPVVFYDGQPTTEGYMGGYVTCSRQGNFMFGAGPQMEEVRRFVVLINAGRFLEQKIRVVSIKFRNFE